MTYESISEEKWRDVRMKIKILLVDEDAEFLEKTKTVWEKESEGVEVVLKTNYKDALEALGRVDFDGIVANYEMPGMNGLNFFERVKEEHKNTPFILLLPEGREDAAINALNKKVDGLMRKELDSKSQYKEIIDKIFEKPIV